jgi:hypothetical protein
MTARRFQDGIAARLLRLNCPTAFGPCTDPYVSRADTLLDGRVSAGLFIGMC